MHFALSDGQEPMGAKYEMKWIEVVHLNVRLTKEDLE